MAARGRRCPSGRRGSARRGAAFESAACCAQMSWELPADILLAAVVAAVAGLSCCAPRDSLAPGPSAAGAHRLAGPANELTTSRPHESSRAARATNSSRSGWPPARAGPLRRLAAASDKSAAWRRLRPSESGAAPGPRLRSLWRAPQSAASAALAAALLHFGEKVPGWREEARSATPLLIANAHLSAPLLLQPRRPLGKAPPPPPFSFASYLSRNSGKVTLLDPFA